MFAIMHQFAQNRKLNFMLDSKLMQGIIQTALMLEQSQEHE
jgi:hypothetical protein